MVLVSIVCTGAALEFGWLVLLGAVSVCDMSKQISEGSWRAGFRGALK